MLTLFLLSITISLRSKQGINNMLRKRLEKFLNDYDLTIEEREKIINQALEHYSNDGELTEWYLYDLIDGI